MISFARGNEVLPVAMVFDMNSYTAAVTIPQAPKRLVIAAVTIPWALEQQAQSVQCGAHANHQCNGKPSIATCFRKPVASQVSLEVMFLSGLNQALQNGHTGI